MKAGLLIVVIVCLSILIAGVIIKMNFPAKESASPARKTLPASVQTYHDPTFGYTFTYPQSYSLTYAENHIFLSNMQTIFSVNVETSASFTFSPRESLIAFCTSIMKRPCLIDSQTVFTNSNGVTGVDYYFTIASHGALLTNVLRGPVYAFPLIAPDHKKGILLFYEEGLSSTDKDKNVLRSVLESLSIPLPTPSLFPTPKSSRSAVFVPKVASSAAK